MKRKILYICLGIFMLIDSVLLTYILKREPVCDRAHWSDVDRTKEIVPDEETARRIAETNFTIEKCGWGYQEGINYQIEVIYDEPSYEWIVTFTPKESEKDEVKMAAVRRDFGAVSVLSGNEYTY